jgi:hypothetical protein
MRRMPTTLDLLWSNVPLRRTLVAYALVSLVEFGTWVAIILYAYAKGGVALAGLVSVAQLVPAAFLAPVFTGMLDRLPRGQALTVARASIAVALLGTVAVLLVDAPVPVVVVMSALSTIAICASRPLHFAALPRLARRRVRHRRAPQPPLSPRSGGRHTKITNDLPTVRYFGSVVDLAKIDKGTSNNTAFREVGERLIVGLSWGEGRRGPFCCPTCRGGAVLRDATQTPPTHLLRRALPPPARAGRGGACCRRGSSCRS